MMSTAESAVRDRSLHDRALTLCAAQPGARLEWPFGVGAPVCKMRGRPTGPATTFALIGGNRLHLKCDPELAMRLRAAHELGTLENLSRLSASGKHE